MRIELVGPGHIRLTCENDSEEAVLIAAFSDEGYADDHKIEVYGYMYSNQYGVVVVDLQD